MDLEGVTIRRREDLERTGNWLLVRRSLGVDAFGLNLVEIPPGERIPEHDETPRDQEEVYVMLTGTAVTIVDGVAHAAPAGTYVRLDPEPLRTIANAGDETVLLLVASAPRSSGYEPMDWA